MELAEGIEDCAGSDAALELRSASPSTAVCLSDILPAASYPNLTGVCLVSSSAFSLALSSSGRG